MKQSSGDMRREDAKACLHHTLVVIARLDRAIQYSRDGCD